MTSSILVW